MTIASRLTTLSETLPKRAAAIETAEQVSQGIVMPILSALGHDIFDPEVVVADYSVNVDRKKTERADHAVIINGKASILIRVRSGAGALDARQLASLATEFSLGKADFVFLVNARYLQVYADLDQAGVIDLLPFITLDLHTLTAADIGQLAQFGEPGFDAAAIRARADGLKFGPLMQDRLTQLLERPTPQFVALLLNGVVSNVADDHLVSRCAGYIRDGFKQLVNDRVLARITRALNDDVVSPPPAAAAVSQSSEDDAVKVLEDEKAGHRIIQAIAFGLAEASDVVLRPAQSYAAILYKDNNRRTIARLHMKRSKWYLGLLDGEKDEVRHEITSVENIFAFAEQIRAIIADLKASAAADVKSARAEEPKAVTKLPAAARQPAAQAEVQPAVVAEVQPATEAATVPADPAAVQDPNGNAGDSDLIEAPAEEQSAAALAAGPDALIAGSEADVVASSVDALDGAPELTLSDFDAIYDSIAAEVGDQGGADDQPVNEALEALINSPINGPEERVDTTVN